MNTELINLLVTVISGVAVYVFSELFTEFVLRPIQEYKQLRGKVSKLLVLYAQYYYNPQPRGSEDNSPDWLAASDALRELASEVAAYAEIKPLSLFTFFIIPTKNKLSKASSLLIGISNSLFESTDHICERVSKVQEYVGEIKKILRI